ncbi:hypothetical protein TUM4261_15040 [Shewanella sp. c952]|uniref:hypothetical protein n=1 Tax=Shewanella sp. c952 TaxID=2815913 RepID=UPI001BC6E0A1|nr:hypothetical protein [Shewanella sp. c952]GIU08393.1 hypothetical protein TUM4261_15040 [Shewanella sp. c952]
MKCFALSHATRSATVVVLLLSSLLSGSALADNDLSNNQSEYQIGFMVNAIDKAITDAQPDSLELIYQYGTDSRYYVMIRGWLVQELTGVQSQLDAHRQQDERRQQLAHKVNFLKQAIRRIDLE